MKKLVYLLALGMIFALCSCGGSKGDKESAKDEKEAEKTKADDRIADCDDFLKRYEEWMNEYVEVMEAVLTGTGEEEGLEERYNALAQEAATWATQWVTLSACAMNEEYQKKYEAIAEKASAKMEELTRELE
jgi:hypothetical protein